MCTRGASELVPLHCSAEGVYVDAHALHSCNRVHAATIESRQKVFITIGHQTTMARTLFFGAPDDSQHACTQAQLGQAMFAHVGKFATEAPVFDLTREYVFQPELYGIAGAVTLPPLYLYRFPVAIETRVVGGTFWAVFWGSQRRATARAVYAVARSSVSSAGRDCRVAAVVLFE